MERLELSLSKFYITVMTGRLELFFGRKKVSLAPRSFAEGAQLLPFLSRVLGEDVQVG
jgi:hypothetical protein